MFFGELQKGGRVRFISRLPDTAVDQKELCSLYRKVEAPITDNFRVLAHVQRLCMQMNIFSLCSYRKYNKCYFFENFIHGIEFT